ncbi:MAG: hypothetical protein ACTSQY_09930 [Candidatus Odinarchaeia archaeon]
MRRISPELARKQAFTIDEAEKVLNVSHIFLEMWGLNFASRGDITRCFPLFIDDLLGLTKPLIIASCR